MSACPTCGATCPHCVRQKRLEQKEQERQKRLQERVERRRLREQKKKQPYVRSFYDATLWEKCK